MEVLAIERMLIELGHDRLTLFLHGYSRLRLQAAFPHSGL